MIGLFFFYLVSFMVNEKHDLKMIYSKMLREMKYKQEKEVEVKI